MNGQQGRCAGLAPGHVSRCHGRWPVVGMHQLRAPLDAGIAGGDFRGRQAEAGETNVVVCPIAPLRIDVRRAVALVQRGVEQDVDDQPIGQIHAPDLARWQCRQARQLPDDADWPAAFNHLAVAWDQQANVVLRRQRTGQRSGNIAEPAAFDQVGEFRGDEQHALTLRMLAVHLQGWLGCGAMCGCGLNVCGGCSACHVSLHRVGPEDDSPCGRVLWRSAMKGSAISPLPLS